MKRIDMFVLSLGIAACSEPAEAGQAGFAGAKPPAGQRSFRAPRVIDGRRVSATASMLHTRHCPSAGVGLRVRVTPRHRQRKAALSSFAAAVDSCGVAGNLRATTEAEGR